MSAAPRVLLAAVSALAMGCGARDSLLVGNGGGHHSTGEAGSGSGASAPVSCAPGGIRLCGGDFGCPELGFEDCPGVGCTPVSHRDTGELLEIGVCWADIENWVNETCVVCAEDEVCVHHTEGELFCIPIEVCETLHAMGAGDACRFTDRSAFEGEPIAPSSTCASLLYACGGTCNACTSKSCVGLSSSSPHGICLSDIALSRCQRDAPNDDCTGTWQCLVFDVPDADQPFADEHGLCVADYICEDAEAAGVATCH